MYRQRMIHFFLFLTLAVLVWAGCTPTTGNDTAVSSTAPPAPTVSEPTSEALALTPQQVTQNFYNWYLETIGNHSDGSFTNPLVEGLYRDSEYLTADFVARIDETLAGFEGGGYDPILQAQDIPVSFEVQEPVINDQAATVIVLFYWGGNPDPSPITVHLRQENGRWRIDNVTAFEIPAPEQPIEPKTPETTVAAFYNEYLGYIGDPATSNFRNPLVDKAYHDIPYLTGSFVQHIDELLAAMREKEAGGYDPFLCAQAIPTFMQPDVTFERNGRASVVVLSSFPNHRLTVDLKPEGERWLITNVICAHDPAGAATAFYTWYLGYIGDRHSGDFRNPLVDKAYHHQPLLAESFVKTVDETVAGFENGGFDPFLLAQDIPQDFSVDPGTAEGTAVVHLQFGPDATKHLLVTTDETGRRIAAISEDVGRPNSAPSGDETAPDQSTFVNETYSFSFTYPAMWRLEEMEQGGPGMPDDWPVAAAWLLMPPDVAEYLANHSGPPDPNAPVIVAPFNVDVVVGGQDALVRVYGDLDGETAVVNAHQAIILRRDPGYSHVIFEHPLRQDVWLVFTDWVTHFPGREAQAETAAPVWDPWLQSLQFNP